MKMGCLHNAVVFLIVIAVASVVRSEDPYLYFDWNITWGTIAPLGVQQTGILINGQFPGPVINSTTNNNVVVNVFNNLDEPFLLTWNGVQQRRNSWEDGVLGTNCPILPGQNFTYKFQVKDQIGSYYYFPSTMFHKAAGGFGGLQIESRLLIPVPYSPPDGEFTILLGDWFNANHSALGKNLDGGKALTRPNGVHINGIGGQSRSVFKVDPGKTYRLRISNVGLATSLNFRIEGHKLKLVEVEGSHTIQNLYDSLDIHVGQSCTVLITADQTPKDYYMVASTRFIRQSLDAVAFLSYSNSNQSATGPLPQGPPLGIGWSLNQAKSIRWNLTASAARPNPQGSYHYGSINISRTVVLANSASSINGTVRYAVNGLSFVQPDTPLKVADYFNVSGVFTVNNFSDNLIGNVPELKTTVMYGEYKAFVEFIFQNNERSIQSWHIDGYSFFVAGMGRGQWTAESRKTYNLFDGINRCTTQVYPKSWTAVLFALDNAGMWNARSQNWARQYLGQQFYIRVYGGTDPRDELPPPHNILTCGRAAGRTVPVSAYAGLDKEELLNL